ncbi:MAG: hypothetical protein O2887_04435 [Bacteroidetes bacterium]|nr:hypothetical protein [Bacteroidota bacterium]MDA1119733.1 hypothetical protein [Bacteroidota bacterium]
MKVIFKMLLTVAFAYMGLMIMPWWILVLIAFVISAAIPTNDFGAFLAGFLGVGLLWLVIAWKIDIKTNSVLSAKIALIIPVGGDTTALVILSGVIGAVVGGFSSLSGNLFRKIFMKKKQKSMYS